jgi:hypothetical protein
VKSVRGLWVVAWLLLVQASQADTIYVVRRGWHIDVGFAAPELVAPLGTVTGEFPGARYLLFGFGDRRYLMAKHSHVPAMLGAVWPGQALILVTGLAATPRQAFGEKGVIALAVSPAQSKELQAFIVGSLEAVNGGVQAVNGDFAVTAPGPYGGSLYFSSGLKYSGFHTCNTWAAEGLHRAQLPIRSRGTLFAGQLWRQVAKLASPPRP